MPRWARLLLAAVILGVVGAVTAGLVVWNRGGTLFPSADDWAVRQVLRIAETYLVPRIEFARSDYEFPGTITFHDVRLTSPDGTEVVRAEALVVELAEAPTRGEPIEIERIELRGGALRLIGDPDDERVQFKGLLPFVKRENVREQTGVDEDLRLSSILKIRTLAVRDGSLVFAPGGEDGRPMELDGLEFDLNVTPAGDGPGWYTLDVALDRSPVLSVAAEGRANIDTLVAELERLVLRMDLTREGAMAALPPGTQEILSEFGARGLVEIEASGRIDARDPAGSTLDAAVSIEQFHTSMGAGSEWRLRIDRGDIRAQMAERKINVSEATLEVHGGTIALTEAWAALDSTGRPFAARWSIDGVSIEQFMKAQEADGTTRLSGLVESSGEATARLDEFPASLNGAGTVKVSEGRLLKIRFISAVARALDVMGHLKGKYQAKDRAEIAFDLTGEGVQVTKGEVITQVVAARFTGLVSFGATLDLRVNAGPLEKLQSLFGPIGDIFGAITDRLVKYHVTGPLREPEVKVRPLGM